MKTITVTTTTTEAHYLTFLFCFYFDAPSILFPHALCKALEAFNNLRYGNNSTNDNGNNAMQFYYLLVYNKFAL